MSVDCSQSLPDQKADPIGYAAAVAARTITVSRTQVPGTESYENIPGTSCVIVLAEFQYVIMDICSKQTSTYTQQEAVGSTCFGGTTPTPKQDHTVPPPPPPSPVPIDNKLLSVTQTIRQPYSSELSNEFFDPTTTLYKATWTPSSSFITETFTYSQTPAKQEQLTDAIGIPMQVASTASSGPWSLAGDASAPATPCYANSIVQTTNGFIYVGTSIGVFISKDLGQTFQFVNGPTQVVQLTTWGNVVMAVTYGSEVAVATALGYITRTPEPPKVNLYYTNNNGSSWQQFYSKESDTATQYGGHVLTPIIVPFDDYPIILDDQLHSVTGLETGSVNVSSNSSGAPWVGISMFTAPAPPNSIQPYYMGVYNGERYITFPTRDTGTNPVFTGINANLVYTIDINGNLTYVGGASMSGDITGENTATGPNAVPGTSPAPAYYPLYTPGVETLFSQVELSFNTQIQLVNGSVLAVPTPRIYGGYVSSINGVPV